MHPQLRKIYVPLSCPSLVVILISVYHLIVKSMRAFLLLLWSVKPFYSGMTRRNKLQYLIRIQDRVKEVVFRRSNANPAFALLYLGALPSLCHECHENCTTSYEFLTQWYFSPSLFIPRSRVVTTGIPTSELWCVKSILWATRCLVVNGQHSHS